MRLKQTIIALALGAAMLTGASPTNAQEHFKRDLEQVSFIPKGQWIAGVSVNYAQSNQNNYQFLILEGVSGNAHTFKISPTALFCFKNDLAAGGRFSFENSRVKMDEGSLKLSEDTHFDADNLYSIRSNYFATALFRNYFSLGNSKRFGFFNEIQLSLGGGRSKLSNGSGDTLTGTYERNFSLDIGLTPGFIMFLSNYSALEVNVGVLGFGYTHTRAVTDQIYVSNRNSKHANFKINLFSISFGVMFYI